MALIQDYWFILLIIGLVSLGVIYSLILPARQREQAKLLEQEDSNRKWQVQCPKCRRWKQLKPVESSYEEAHQGNTAHVAYPGAQYKYANGYKCPFCGHRWQEYYLE